MERDPGIWDELHRNVRKAERAHFEANERDEGELERTGQPLYAYMRFIMELEPSHFYIVVMCIVG